MGSTQRSDGDLLSATVVGDGGAFAVFYHRHLSAVVGYLVRETRDRELAADLSAEVFAAVLISAGRFRARGDGSAAPWVRGIAQNKLLESQRRGRVEDRARRRLAIEPEALQDEDLQRVDDLAASEGTLALLDQLPDSERGAVRARVIDGREYEEIAAELQTSKLVVRQRVSRGLARLRNQIGENP
jgi:RNA polymerase sigma factor (sigma-70 family)